MHIIDVTTTKPYQVALGTMLLERTGEIVRGACGGTRAVIITDSNVGPLYAHIVRESLEHEGYTVSIFTFPAGEEHKCASTLIDALEFIAEAQLSRSDCVVALGGGVTGDLAGFAAATYMRGCHFVQMPTSLLAMVDSSVGGKTAIDLKAGKNLAGAFWQPDVVIADIGCLGTLEDDRVADGCGEVIKHGVITDAELFATLEQTPLTADLIRSDLALVERLIARNIEIKRDVVVADERESNLRKLLNFGHSIGHAVEACANYQLGHGTCVAIGMVAIARAAAARGVCAPDVPQRIEAVCRAHGLATRTACSVDDIFEAALHDKKRAGDAIDIVLPHRVGACSIEHVSLAAFKTLIEDGIQTGANA